MENRESSFIAAYDYSQAHHTLTVRMKSGKVYVYQQVPPEVYAEFDQAESLGRYFGARIKGKFDVIVEAPEPIDDPGAGERHDDTPVAPDGEQ